MMMKRLSLAGLLALLLAALCLLPAEAAADDEIVLRISNWEEYIDLGDWDPENDLIDLESGDIFGENPLVDDFEDWYYETYGKKVRVEYSTFGTNEDLYNMLTIGDVFDLVCPSDYMIMKLMAEDQVEPLSEAFFDDSREDNYYVRGVSPYIRKIFEEHTIEGTPWSECAACYMWGVTGFLYNPESLSEEDEKDFSTWKVLENTKYRRQITIKDNVRDAYFAAVGALKSDLLMDDAFRNDPDYAENLQREMNDVSRETVDRVQEYLQDIKDNLYSFETDSGKADMITGKIVANYQWSGDAVYAMDQAETEDDCYLKFAVPEESTNIYFDGWIMLKKGIDGDAGKKHAAEAFINFISRPDNVIRNMYYIGYTSAISGGEDGRIFEYVEWSYGAEEEEEEEEEESGEETGEEETEPEDGDEAAPEAEENPSEKADGTEADGTETDAAEASGETSEADSGTSEEDAEGSGSDDEGVNEPEGEDAEESDAEEADTVEYDLSYFFSGDGSEGEYVLTVERDQLQRQLSAQYPSEDVIHRASIMIYFDDEQNEIINRMWVRVRCFNINDVPVYVWGGLGVLAAGGIGFHFRRKAMKNKLYS